MLPQGSEGGSSALGSDMQKEIAMEGESNAILHRTKRHYKNLRRTYMDALWI